MQRPWGRNAAGKVNRGQIGQGLRVGGMHLDSYSEFIGGKRHELENCFSRGSIWTVWSAAVAGGGH